MSETIGWDKSKPQSVLKNVATPPQALKTTHAFGSAHQCLGPIRLDSGIISVTDGACNWTSSLHSCSTAAQAGGLSVLPHLLFDLRSPRSSYTELANRAREVYQ
ncbi:MAG: hypothetical protein QOE61_6263 [Micromonosporaceae bacterium]|nr:hypothetical protein [Micromonosporaceae bacterium]